VVSVRSVAFAPTIVAVPDAPGRDIGTVVQDVQRPMMGLVGFALIAVIAFFSLRTIKRSAPASAPVLALPRGSDGAHALGAPAIPLPAIATGNGMRDRVAASIEQQPDVAARVVRAWLKE